MIEMIALELSVRIEINCRTIQLVLNNQLVFENCVVVCGENPAPHAL